MRLIIPMRMTRREMLKASLVGSGTLAAATGLGRLLAPVIAANPVRGGWQQLAPRASPPSTGSVMTLGPRGVPVLFSEWTAETWIWSGANWIKERPQQNPPPRWDAVFAYHPPTKEAVLFGGADNSGWLADTWIWDGRRWRKGPGEGPAARSGAVMAYDPVRRSLILFSGFDSSKMDDTWAWDGSTWRLLTPTTRPPATSGASLAYSAALGKLILFGGKPCMMGCNASDETWAWDGKTWSQLSAGSPPPGRYYAAMAAAPEGGVVILFGGADGSPEFGDTWVLKTQWSRDTRSPAPSARVGACMAFNPSNRAFILFGGSDGPRSLLADTWIWRP